MLQNKVQEGLRFLKLLKMHFHGLYNAIIIQVEYLTFYNLRKLQMK